MDGVDKGDGMNSDGGKLFTVCNAPCIFPTPYSFGLPLILHNLFWFNLLSTPGPKNIGHS